jgi:hypothetical protein
MIRARLADTYMYGHSDQLFKLSMSSSKYGKLVKYVLEIQRGKGQIFNDSNDSVNFNLKAIT